MPHLGLHFEHQGSRQVVLKLHQNHLGMFKMQPLDSSVSLLKSIQWFWYKAQKFAFTKPVEILLQIVWESHYKKTLF